MIDIVAIMEHVAIAIDAITIDANIQIKIKQINRKIPYLIICLITHLITHIISLRNYILQ